MRKNTSGLCPHCSVSVRFEATTVGGGRGSFGEIDPISVTARSQWTAFLEFASCPACGKILVLINGVRSAQGIVEKVNRLVWPQSGNRPVPVEVEGEEPRLAKDFREAVAVLPHSQQASAALSRRCLQLVLLHKAGAKKGDLADQIDEVLPSLPSQLAANVDAIRHIGNFAAHPLKSKSSNEIVDVEEGEAEWSLDVLEQLFDHYFVLPARAAEKRAALNAKLVDMGKPPLKTP